ncbi:hypothetical protein [Streptomyces sp. XD-27]|uniref:hypothetical protein n=1 Tax=Streptomyces sp. XD-27 TaxID=3062779 RepID=UPI0026F420E6|nr:hypothetical protein [Streptomyces sp. XD-27]WKX72735.1 hypothetical protein Q3Y56_25065 [Streptomyces sp. XD-27]
MRTSKATYTAVSAAICGSLVLGFAGPAIADGPIPDRPASAKAAPRETSHRLVAIHKLRDAIQDADEFIAEARQRDPDRFRLGLFRDRVETNGINAVQASKKAALKAKIRGKKADPSDDLVGLLERLLEGVDELLAAVLADRDKSVRMTLEQDLSDVQEDLRLVLPRLLTVLL